MHEKLIDRYIDYLTIPYTTTNQMLICKEWKLKEITILG